MRLLWLRTLLHDAVEDIPEVTFKMIEDKYGKQVANIVKLVTKLPDVDYKVADNIKLFISWPDAWFGWGQSLLAESRG